MKDLKITPLRINDDIKTEFARHHFATISNGINLTLDYKKQWCGRIFTSKLHAIVINWFQQELKNISSDLFGKSIIKIYNE